MHHESRFFLPTKTLSQIVLKIGTIELLIYLGSSYKPEEMLPIPQWSLTGTDMSDMCPRWSFQPLQMMLTALG